MDETLFVALALKLKGEVEAREWIKRVAQELKDEYPEGKLAGLSRLVQKQALKDLIPELKSIGTLVKFRQLEGNGNG